MSAHYVTTRHILAKQAASVRKRADKNNMLSKASYMLNRSQLHDV